MLMRQMLSIGVMAAAVLLSGCSGNNNSTTINSPALDSDQLAALYNIQNNINSQFNAFDQALQFAARQMVIANMQGDMAVGAIQNLAGANPWVRLAGSVGLDGKPQILYPQVFLSDSEPYRQMLKDLQDAMPTIRDGSEVMGPARRNQFRSMLVNYIYPVKGKDQVVIGAVFIQFAAEGMLQDIVIRQIVGFTVNVWVVQTDGLIIYDNNPNEINLNVLTDEPFIKFPDLLACARNIVAQQSGVGHYTFITKGAKVVHGKSAQWTSAQCGGREWRIVMNFEDRVAQ